jgi:hypothetical protein
LPRRRNVNQSYEMRNFNFAPERRKSSSSFPHGTPRAIDRHAVRGHAGCMSRKRAQPSGNSSTSTGIDRLVVLRGLSCTQGSIDALLETMVGGWGNGSLYINGASPASPGSIPVRSSESFVSHRVQQSFPGFFLRYGDSNNNSYRRTNRHCVIRWVFSATPVRITFECMCLLFFTVIH